LAYHVFQSGIIEGRVTHYPAIRKAEKVGDVFARHVFTEAKRSVFAESEGE